MPYLHQLVVVIYSTKMPEATEAPPTAQCNFVTRFSGLPAVASVWGTAAESYSRVKTSNGLLAYAMDAAEKSAALALERGKPVVDKLVTPLSYVDVLACKGLDKLEEVYPGVSKNAPEQIVADAVEYGLKKYGDAKDYGISKVSCRRRRYWCILYSSSIAGIPRTRTRSLRFPVKTC